MNEIFFWEAINGWSFYSGYTSLYSSLCKFSSSSYFSSSSSLLKEMRRYQSLRSLRRSNNLSRRDVRPLSRSEKFVSESHLRDLILYNRLSRSRPRFRNLEYASEDVDWIMEYYFDQLVECITFLFSWIPRLLFIISFFLRKLLTKLFRQGKQKSYYDGGDQADDDDFNYPEKERVGDEASSPTSSIKASLNKYAKSKVWRFQNCRPFLHRRYFKRKWLHKPETRQWAKKTMGELQQKVNQGYRCMRSGIGKDTKIYVVDVEELSSSSTEGGASCSSSSVITTSVFHADSAVLKARSELFRIWFSLNPGKKAIETSFVTPEEMEAILVYIYTGTWPTSMIFEERISPRFFEILAIYGIPLCLPRKSPYHDYQEDDLCPYTEDDLPLEYFADPSLYGNGEGDSFHVVDDSGDNFQTSVSSFNKGPLVLSFPSSSNSSMTKDKDVRKSPSRWRSPLSLRTLKSANQIYPESVVVSLDDLIILHNPFVTSARKRENINKNDKNEAVETPFKVLQRS